MNIDEAKKKIKELEEYIDLIESYNPTNMDEEAIKLYALHENVTKVTKELNDKGYREGNRKLLTTDISKILKSKPEDALHELVFKMFNQNKKKASRRGWL